MELKIVQATDLHLPKQEGELSRGVSNDQRWRAVLSHVRDTHPDLDLLVLTGDLVNGGHKSAYTRLITDIACRLPTTEVVWLPGNHDDRAVMLDVDHAYNKHSQSHVLGRQQWKKGSWQLVFLDSSAEPNGKGRGSLSDDSADCLHSLEPTPSTPYTLLAVHHNPRPVKSRWQDEIMMANADRFWQLVGAKSGEQGERIKGVIFGHIHQVHRSEYKGIALFGSPATAQQFKPHCDVYTLEVGLANRPAYSVYALKGDGSIEASVEYVDL